PPIATRRSMPSCDLVFCDLATEPGKCEPADGGARSSSGGWPGAAPFVAEAAHGHPPLDALNRTPRGSVLTANRPADGAVVFLDFEGDWSDNLAVAVVARAADERRALNDRGRYEAERRLVIEPHLLEVEEIEGRLIPLPHTAVER